ncbi:MAG: hypothetical protein AAFY12_12250 [Pseudomonadota bacterium]
MSEATASASIGLKAFQVQEPHEGKGGILFEKTAIAARRNGASIYNDDELRGMSVTRRRDLDKYERTGVPASVLIGEGWWMECHGCGMTITEDSLEDEKRLRWNDVVGFEHDVYCCHACRMSSLATAAARKVFGDAFLDMMKDIVRKCFPETEAHFDDYRHHVYVPGQHTPFVVGQASVQFSFPGMEFGPAALVLRHEGQFGSALHGPARAIFTCCSGDREAFEEFVRDHKRSLNEHDQSERASQ